MNKVRAPSPPAFQPRAFTLLELIAVVIIMALIAAMTVPKMVGNQSRQFRNTVDQVADLLTMYAQRQNLAQRAVGLQHDRQRNWLMLVQIDIDPAAADRRAVWHDVTSVQPVELPAFMLPGDIDIFADGERIDASYQPLTTEVGHDRPLIEITMRGAGEQATLVLYPHAVAPIVTAPWGQTGIVRQRIDLDNAGRSREDWR